MENTFSIKDKSFCCPVEFTLEVVGGKYKMLLLWTLTNGTKRFTEIQKSIPHATNKMLVQQLRELERDGLIHREVFAVVPPKVEYSLTEVGQSFLPVMSSMAQWAYQFLEVKEDVVV